jgi:hypothetical protein
MAWEPVSFTACGFLYCLYCPYCLLPHLPHNTPPLTALGAGLPRLPRLPRCFTAFALFAIKRLFFYQNQTADFLGKTEIKQGNGRIEGKMEFERRLKKNGKKVLSNGKLISTKIGKT